MRRHRAGQLRARPHFDPELISSVGADAQKPASIHLQTGSLDRTFPARDLLDHIFGKVFGPAPFWCNADYADGVKPCLDRGVSIAAWVASFSLATISFGAPFGRKKAVQVTTS